MTSGTYYLEVEGYYEEVATEYALYAYWQGMSYLENFAYDIYEDGFIS